MELRQLMKRGENDVKMQQWYQNSQDKMLKNNLCMDVVLILGFSVLFILKTKM